MNLCSVIIIRGKTRPCEKAWWHGFTVRLHLLTPTAKSFSDDDGNIINNL